jgi:hypothetical protein
MGITDSMYFEVDHSCLNPNYYMFTFQDNILLFYAMGLQPECGPPGGIVRPATTSVNHVCIIKITQ